MSDQFDTYDEVFRSKLSDHAVSPPDIVWENIQAKRSFGHIVANKISVNWRIFGTMLLLLLGSGTGSILIGSDEASSLFDVKKDYEQSAQIQDQIENNQHVQPAQNLDADQTIQTEVKPDNVEESFNPASDNTNHLPDLELIASVEQAGFTRPYLKDNLLLNTLIQEQDGWESAKPLTFSRYFEMKALEPADLKFENQLQERTLSGLELEYDYVKDGIKKKRFKDRASLLLSFTPQSITKRMIAEYNLSSSYLRHRSSSEQTRLAYTLEANLHYEMNNHKFIESGLNFTQIYEEMHFSGDKVFSNQYNFLEIPFLIGYEDRNAKWGFQVKGGFGLQILNTYDGYIYKIYNNNFEPAPTTNNGAQYRMRTGDAVKNVISSNHSLSHNQDPNEVLDLSQDDQNPFKSSGVVNLHMAAGLTYYHSIKTSFVISPYYRRSVNSITKESALFSERITYMGISVGTMVKF